MKIVMSMGDTHYPTHNEATVSIAKKMMKDLKPTHFVFGGDEVNCDGISRFTSQTVANGIADAITELEGFRDNIYLPFKEILPKAKFYHCGDNHCDQRISDLLLKLEEKGEYGMAKYVRKELDLKKYYPGAKLCDYNEFHQIGNAYFTHGDYTNDAHAKKHVMNWAANIIYFHTHTSQLYTNISKLNEPHQGIAMPCACDRNPKYMKNKANKWLNGIGVTYVEKDGSFWHYIINVIDGKAIFNGKLYKA